MFKIETCKIAVYSIDTQNNKVKYLNTKKLYLLTVFKWVFKLNRIIVNYTHETVCYVIDGLVSTNNIPVEEQIRIKLEMQMNSPIWCLPAYNSVRFLCLELCSTP